MRKYISLLLALLLTSSVCATAANTKVVASGKIVSKEIKGIAGFKEIQTNSSVSVIYHNAADTRIVVSASDNVIPYIEVVKKGSRLEVGLKKNINVRVKNSRADLKVNVYGPEVSAFTVKGSGDISCRATKQLSTAAMGSGNIYYYGNPAKVIGKNKRVKARN